MYIFLRACVYLRSNAYLSGHAVVHFVDLFCSFEALLRRRECFKIGEIPILRSSRQSKNVAFCRDDKVSEMVKKNEEEEEAGHFLSFLL